MPSTRPLSVVIMKWMPRSTRATAFEGAVVEDVGRLGGPRGDGALARGDEEAAVIGAVEMVVCAASRAKARSVVWSSSGVGGLDEVALRRRRCG